MRSGGPHAEPPPPASIFRFFMRLSFPMRFRGLPTHGPPPHTVSRFPHTTTRLTHFPIRFPRIHHTIRKLQRIRPQTRRDQRPAPQIPNQSNPNRYPEPALHLRKSSAGQVTQILQTCNWGWRWHLLHVCAHLHVRAHLHGHAHMHMSIPGHAFDETSGRSPQTTNRFRHASSLSQRPVHSNLRIQPAYSDSTVQPLGGMYGIASRCVGVSDDAASASTSGGGGQHLCYGRAYPGPSQMIGPEGPMVDGKPA